MKNVGPFHYSNTFIDVYIDQSKTERRLDVKRKATDAEFLDSLMENQKKIRRNQAEDHIEDEEIDNPATKWHLNGKRKAQDVKFSSSPAGNWKKAKKYVLDDEDEDDKVDFYLSDSSELSPSPERRRGRGSTSSYAHGPVHGEVNNTSFKCTECNHIVPLYLITSHGSGICVRNSTIAGPSYPQANLTSRPSPQGDYSSIELSDTSDEEEGLTFTCKSCGDPEASPGDSHGKGICDLKLAGSIRFHILRPESIDSRLFRSPRTATKPVTLPTPANRLISASPGTQQCPIILDSSPAIASSPDLHLLNPSSPDPHFYTPLQTPEALDAPCPGHQQMLKTFIPMKM